LHEEVEEIKARRMVVLDGLGVAGDEQATTRKWRWRSVLHRGRRGRKVAA
jgi:glutathione synthase/RimK-type ligase-like ATP-grasp enzyme